MAGEKDLSLKGDDAVEKDKTVKQQGGADVNAPMREKGRDLALEGDGALDDQKRKQGGGLDIKAGKNSTHSFTDEESMSISTGTGKKTLFEEEGATHIATEEVPTHLTEETAVLANVDDKRKPKLEHDTPEPKRPALAMPEIEAVRPKKMVIDAPDVPKTHLVKGRSGSGATGNALAGASIINAGKAQKEANKLGDKDLANAYTYSMLIDVGDIGLNSLNAVGALRQTKAASFGKINPIMNVAAIGVQLYVAGKSDSPTVLDSTVGGAVGGVTATALGASGFVPIAVATDIGSTMAPSIHTISEGAWESFVDSEFEFGSNFVTNLEQSTMLQDGLVQWDNAAAEVEFRYGTAAGWASVGQSVIEFTGDMTRSVAELSNDVSILPFRIPGSGVLNSIAEEVEDSFDMFSATLATMSHHIGEFADEAKEFATYVRDETQYGDRSFLSTWGFLGGDNQAAEVVRGLEAKQERIEQLVTDIRHHVQNTDFDAAHVALEEVKQISKELGRTEASEKYVTVLTGFVTNHKEVDMLFAQYTNTNQALYDAVNGDDMEQAGALLTQLTEYKDQLLGYDVLTETTKSDLTARFETVDASARQMIGYYGEFGDKLRDIRNGIDDATTYMSMADHVIAGNKPLNDNLVGALQQNDTDLRRLERKLKQIQDEYGLHDNEHIQNMMNNLQENRLAVNEKLNYTPNYEIELDLDNQMDSAIAGLKNIDLDVLNLKDSDIDEVTSQTLAANYDKNKDSSKTIA